MVVTVGAVVPNGVDVVGCENILVLAAGCDPKENGVAALVVVPKP